MYLIGGVIAVVGALLFSGVAASLPVGQTLQTTYSPSKEDKKKFGGVTLHLRQEFAYDAFVTSRSPRQMVFAFPTDVKLVLGNVPVCPLSQLKGKLEPAARAASPKSILAQGSLQVNRGALNATFTFFRGESALNQDIIVHTSFEGGELLVDVIANISNGGRTLTFDNMPDAPGSVLTAIDTTIYKRRTGESTFFVMARCGRKRWPTTETITYHSGESLSTTSTQKCKQKPAKK
jgi:hypothetical protein